jgi:hypothetical protein
MNFHTHIRRLTSIRINLTPWSESDSEVYGPSDLRLSAKLVPTFADRGVSRGQPNGYPGHFIGFLDRSR